MNGTKGKKLHRHGGEHLDKDSLFERFSATKRYQEWRNSVVGGRSKNTGEYMKVPRKVRLIEHEPYAPKGEAGKWAANIKALESLLMQPSRGTHFTFVVGHGRRNTVCRRRHLSRMVQGDSCTSQRVPGEFRSGDRDRFCVNCQSLPLAPKRRPRRQNDEAHFRRLVRPFRLRKRKYQNSAQPLGYQNGRGQGYKSLEA
jgi:hypothetical protein